MLVIFLATSRSIIFTSDKGIHFEMYLYTKHGVFSQEHLAGAGFGYEYPTWAPTPNGGTAPFHLTPQEGRQRHDQRNGRLNGTHSQGWSLSQRQSLPFPWRAGVQVLDCATWQAWVISDPRTGKVPSQLPAILASSTIFLPQSKAENRLIITLDNTEHTTPCLSLDFFFKSPPASVFGDEFLSHFFFQPSNTTASLRIENISVRMRGKRKRGWPHVCPVKNVFTYLASPV